MKRVFLLLASALFAMSIGHAQNETQYQLTPNGLINGTDKDYIVIEADSSLTQKDLFEKTQTYLASKFVSPQDVISAFNENTITINWTSHIFYKVTIGKMEAVVNYTTTFLFKDGRVRINNPSINSITCLDGKNSPMKLIEEFYTIGIFTSKGKDRRPEVKTAIEGNINSFLSDYVGFITSKQDVDEDW